MNLLNTAEGLDDDTSSTVNKQLRRIVYLTPDISTIGGIQSRVRRILRNSASRPVEYVGLSRRNTRKYSAANHYAWDDDSEAVKEALKDWSPHDTVIMVPNNTLKVMPEEIKSELNKFPLVFNGSGQLSFLLQDSSVVADRDYAESFLVTKLLLFSQMDRLTYSQFGIHHHELGFHPVEVRPDNFYSTERNTKVGYVGRIDYYTKGADRLFDAASALRDCGKGPLYVYAVSNPKNSPQIEDFLAAIIERGLKDDISVIFDEEDKNEIYSDLSLMLLPSRKDSFPNVVLEAYSFGVPVVGTSYAPGPSELIVDGETGFLLNDFGYDDLLSVFRLLDSDTLQRLSGNAFERHKSFSMDSYYRLAERVCGDTLREFDGANLRRVFPELKPIQLLQEKVEKERGKLKAEAAKRKALEKQFNAHQKELEEARSALNGALLNAENIKKSRTFRLGKLLAECRASPAKIAMLPFRFFQFYLNKRNSSQTNRPL